MCWKRSRATAFLLFDVWFFACKKLRFPQILKYNSSECGYMNAVERLKQCAVAKMQRKEGHMQLVCKRVLASPATTWAMVTLTKVIVKKH